MKIITILFILTSHSQIEKTKQPTGVWLEELSTPYYALIDAGYKVEIASINGGKAPIDPKSLGSDEKSVNRYNQDKDLQTKLANTINIAEIDLSKYDGVFLPGGHGTMWDLPNNQKLAEIIATALEQNKPVAAVCHGPAGLVSAKYANGDSVVKGKNIAAFSNAEEAAVELTEVVPFLLEDKLKALGAKYHAAENFAAYAVRDGYLITGQNPASSQKVAELLIQTLNEVE
jgi:putative intracellular protease/amidase